MIDHFNFKVNTTNFVHISPQMIEIFNNEVLQYEITKLKRKNVDLKNYEGKMYTYTYIECGGNQPIGKKYVGLCSLYG